MWFGVALWCAVVVVRGETETGGVFDGNSVLRISDSPYLVTSDIVVPKFAQMTIDPGVELNFKPGVGVDVTGILKAEGRPNQRIKMKAAFAPPKKTGSPSIRLVDGPNILSGRVQVHYQGSWRPVCTNSRNWTITDMEVVCRQLGWAGGRWYDWFDRLNNSRPLLIEKPKCNGPEERVQECDGWSERQMGGGVCDFHPDIGIECLPFHHPDTPKGYWRGVRFLDADSNVAIVNYLHQHRSKSVLHHVDIENAGMGMKSEVHSAVESWRVPPQLEDIRIRDCAYNGINITRPLTGFLIQNATITNVRGYGVYVNSSNGLVEMQGCSISNTLADGVKYVHHDAPPESLLDGVAIVNLCQGSSPSQLSSQLSVIAERTPYEAWRDCSGTFNVRTGQLLTIHTPFMYTWWREGRSEGGGIVEIRDGHSETSPLLLKYPISNFTRPQSIVTEKTTVWIRIDIPRDRGATVYFQITPGETKSHNLLVKDSAIEKISGRGVWTVNTRSMVEVRDSTVTECDHVAGIHVDDGAGNVNVTNSNITDNLVDGINITYAGGKTNVSGSYVSRNKGYGFAIWLNETSEIIVEEQETMIGYSTFSLNEGIGVLVGNFCREGFVNVSGNLFTECPDTALEILSCWKEGAGQTEVQVGHNKFFLNKLLALKIEPAVNMEGKIEYNNFEQNTRATLMIRNPDMDELNFLPTSLNVTDSFFRKNRGMFVISLGVSQEGLNQSVLFSRNYVQDNIVSEPFPNLNSRSRRAAVIVITSPGTKVYKNVLKNDDSHYEIASHLENPSVILPCQFNFFEMLQDKKISNKLFGRNDRYNLASIEFKPYLWEDCIAETCSPTGSNNDLYVPEFFNEDNTEIGGEVSGERELIKDYLVTKDIYVRPSGHLKIAYGVTLKFTHGIGMLVLGQLTANGIGSSGNKRVTFSLLERTVTNNTDVSVKLVAGQNFREGRLQVKIKGRWGTVCGYGWTKQDASLVCRMMGLVLSPEDWLMDRSDMPNGGSDAPILMSNVKCSDLDTDLVNCKHEPAEDIENSCTHEDDVGVRCSDVSWSGIRLGMAQKISTLKNAYIEKAGLLDPSVDKFKPALQIDFHHHVMQNVHVSNNLYDGLGVMYHDLHLIHDSNARKLRDAVIQGNKGNGITVRTPGMTILRSIIADNKGAGFHYDPSLSRQEQRELLNWMKVGKLPFIQIPREPSNHIQLSRDVPVYFITELRTEGTSTHKTYTFETEDANVIGIQVLNPINHRSTEEIIIYDYKNTEGEIYWSLDEDRLVFPTVSTGFIITLKYTSGTAALGDVVILLTAIKREELPIEYQHDRILVPTTRIEESKIQRNTRGLYTMHYNRYLSEDFNHHYFRCSNESIEIVQCEISSNREEAWLEYSPYAEAFMANMSEIAYHINYTTLQDNGWGVTQYSRDLLQSNNLYHWVMQENIFKENRGGGVQLVVPYVWQYNENYTHTFSFNNCSFINNFDFVFSVDGHFARMNVTHNIFTENTCKRGLISIQGMEKEMIILKNDIRKNTGEFMLEIHSDSQSEILGWVEAHVVRNLIQHNRHSTSNQRVFDYHPKSYVVALRGLQTVIVHRNLLGNNDDMDYELLAGIVTASLDTRVDVTSNWWGTTDKNEIRERIFDFDDWNNYAIADFQPFLLENSFTSSASSSFEIEIPPVDPENIGGRLKHNLYLQKRAEPYYIRSDLTVLPGATLKIDPGVEVAFYPSVSILVLGMLRAEGSEFEWIRMRPVTHEEMDSQRKDREMNRRRRRAAYNPRYEKRSWKPPNVFRYSVTESKPLIRLCTGYDCEDDEGATSGFVEMYNTTTLQWVPICDRLFSEKNAEVACREMGFDPLNVFYSYGPRVEYHPNSLTRIVSWPDPISCKGNERSLSECTVQMIDEVYGFSPRCPYDGDFLFLHCGKRNLPSNMEYWGGIRFAKALFEPDLVYKRVHDEHTHSIRSKEKSSMHYVNIMGAGIVHGEKTAGILSVQETPYMWHIHVSNCAWDGFNMISPQEDLQLMYNRVYDNLGAGIHTVVLHGDGTEAEESSFVPLSEVHLPRNVFGMMDICDTSKVVQVEERILLYYKYRPRSADCVKIFNSVYDVKNFGFRLLQLNLYNSTGVPGTKDSITLFDGDIYNITSEFMASIYMEAGDDPLPRKFYVTSTSSLSVKLHATANRETLGFIAEVVTLPPSGFVYGRDLHHNISFSLFTNNQGGAVVYSNAGEVNPMLTIEGNRFLDNGINPYGNFSTANGAVNLNLQNTPHLYFKNNLLRGNQGGLHIKADSSNVATALQGVIRNCLFVENQQREALLATSGKSSPYQQLDVFFDYFTRANASYRDVIHMNQVLMNFSYNYVHDNYGQYILTVLGFDNVRLPTFQAATHNTIFNNYALEPEFGATILAGSSGQQYVHNILFNPDNVYEIVTLNKSSLDVWKTPIDAKHNWWGYNVTAAVLSRVWDKNDGPGLLEVDLEPFLLNNKTLLDGGKCPPGWNIVGDTCFIYIGAPLTFKEAREFCTSVNASMPYLQSNHRKIYQYIYSMQENFQPWDMVWVQHLDIIGECPVFRDYDVTTADCSLHLPFLCESDPAVTVDPLSWITFDPITIIAVVLVLLALLLVLICLGCWYCKSKHRSKQRLERKNSIRASIRTNKSIISSSGGFSELGAYRRRIAEISSASNVPVVPLSNTSTMSSKMMNGSVDSIEKSPSQLNSSLDGRESYDCYEARNPRYMAAPLQDQHQQDPEMENHAVDAMVHPTFDLTYKNQGFRDVSHTSREPSWRTMDSTYASSHYPMEGSSTFTKDSEVTVPFFDSEANIGVPYMDSVDRIPPSANSTLELKRSYDNFTREVEGREDPPPIPTPPRRDISLSNYAGRNYGAAAAANYGATAPGNYGAAAQAETYSNTSRFSEEPLETAM